MNQFGIFLLFIGVFAIQHSLGARVKPSNHGHTGREGTPELFEVRENSINPNQRHSSELYGESPHQFNQPEPVFEQQHSSLNTESAQYFEHSENFPFSVTSPILENLIDKRMERTNHEILVGTDQGISKIVDEMVNNGLALSYPMNKADGSYLEFLAKLTLDLPDLHLNVDRKPISPNEIKELYEMNKIIGQVSFPGNFESRSKILRSILELDHNVDKKPSMSPNELEELVKINKMIGQGSIPQNFKSEPKILRSLLGTVGGSSSKDHTIDQNNHGEIENSAQEEQTKTSDPIRENPSLYKMMKLKSAGNKVWIDRFFVTELIKLYPLQPHALARQLIIEIFNTNLAPKQVNDATERKSYQLRIIEGVTGLVKKSIPSANFSRGDCAKIFWRVMSDF